MRVVLADDHTLVRAGLRALIEDIGGISVVAEAGDGPSALEMVRRHKPDLLVTDASMPGMNGIELTEKVRSEHPDVRVIVVSMFASQEFVVRALKAGASAYLLKDAAQSELEAALSAVQRGDTYLSHKASRTLVEHIRGGKESDPLAELTDRQKQILKLIAEGANTKQIAHDLQLSPKTVEAHRSQIMDRLNIRDVPGLVKAAIRAGLVSHDG